MFAGSKVSIQSIEFGSAWFPEAHTYPLTVSVQKVTVGAQYGSCALPAYGGYSDAAGLDA